VKIGPAVPEISSRTDRQTHTHTDKQIDCNNPLPYWGGVTQQRNVQKQDKVDERSKRN